MTRRREVETDEFMAFARRIVKATGKRVGDGDPVDLASLVALRREFEAIEVQAVQAMRDNHGYSWSEIGRDLGITRQAAQQFYGRKIASQASA